MPDFPLRRISHSGPRMWRTCRSDHGVDRGRRPAERERAPACPHVCRELGQLSVNGHVQSLDAPRHRGTIPDMVSSPTKNGRLQQRDRAQGHRGWVLSGMEGQLIARIRLLRNVGTFDSVAAGAAIVLSRLAVIYAENGRGKTTLAAVLRSLATGDPVPISERRRLAAQHPPHIVVQCDDAPHAICENGTDPNPGTNGRLRRCVCRRKRVFRSCCGFDPPPATARTGHRCGRRSTESSTPRSGAASRDAQRQGAPGTPSVRVPGQPACRRECDPSARRCFLDFFAMEPLV